MNTWQACLQLMRNQRKIYLINALLWGVFHLMPLLPGLITRSVLDKLTGNAAVGWSIGTLLALLVGIGIARFGNLLIGFFFYVKFRHTTAATLRINMLKEILRHPGAAALPNSSGEAVSRFSGDVNEITRFAIDRMVDVWGLALLPLIGLGVMFSINPRITLVIIVPLALVMVMINLMRRRMEQYRDARRRAASRVIGFIAEMFGSVQAVKVANAERHINARLAELNEERRSAALKDTLFGELISTSFGSTVEVSTGIILIMAGQAMSRGTFTVGDFALFVAYLWEVTEGLTFIGNMFAVQKQVDVSVHRMARQIENVRRSNESDFAGTAVQSKGMVAVDTNSKAIQHAASAVYAKLVAPTPVYLDGNFPPLPHWTKSKADRLQTLVAQGLSYRHPTTGRGINDVDLQLQRGSFTVVTGRIGAGKSTLLRVLLGLLPIDSGEVRWNGELVARRDDFFVPPRAAYTGQVPRLFSDTLRNNILMGMPVEDADLEGAIYGAVMEKDLVDLEMGFETMVGPRGVRLSGGQIQRSAAARMIVRRPELYVFDDLSSALDVETEKTLWDRLFDQNTLNGDMPTCLVVSHRRTALRRADHIIVLKEGEVEDEGSLDTLLERCREMQQLWEGRT